MATTVGVSFRMDSLQIVHALNDGNANFADRDVMSFTVMHNDQFTTVIPATVLDASLAGYSSGGVLGGYNLILSNPAFVPPTMFTVQEGDVLTLIPLVACDDSGTDSDAEARHNKALARVLDIYSASLGSAGVIVGVAGGPLGVIVGIVCGVVAGILQLAKDCIGDTATPRNGVVFAPTPIQYTFDQLILHAVDGHTGEGQDEQFYWKKTIPYTSADGTASSILTFTVFRSQEVDQFGPGVQHGPGKITPRVGGQPSDWTPPSHVWRDSQTIQTSRVSVTVASGPTDAPSFYQKVLLYLGSPEAQYRAGEAPATFDLTTPRPKRQIPIEPFMPAGFEVQCQTAAEVVVQEGSKPYASDRYNGSAQTVWTVPMIATPYAGPIYPPFHGEVALGGVVAVDGVVSAAIRARRVAPGVLRPVSGPVRITAPQPVQYADTICLPGGVFLQLYAVHDMADTQSIWSNAVRYLRYESGVAVTDVMLSPYTPLPT